MAYINFKEEISAAKTQLEKRVSNNIKVFEKSRTYKVELKEITKEKK